MLQLCELLPFKISPHHTPNTLVRTPNPIPFTDTRLAIAALLPTPLCIHHFAQPSTMGASYIQSFIADNIIAPPEHQPFYTEVAPVLLRVPKVF